MLEITSFLRENDDFAVICHYDADGLTAGAISALMLDRLGKKYSVTPARQLDEQRIQAVKDKGKHYLFVDMGSGQIPVITEHFDSFGIIDHHETLGDTDQPHFNAHLMGWDGAKEISGAGCTYMVAKAVDKKNVDLSPIALVGAVGDMQDSTGALVGKNREILEDGIKTGLIEAKNDISLYGRHSRPLTQFLAFSSEPFFQGLTGDEDACGAFLSELGIPVKKNEEWVYYSDLSESQKKKLISALFVLGKRNFVPEFLLKSLVREVYELTQEEPRTPLRDAREFATVLNACVAPDSLITSSDGLIMTIDGVKQGENIFSLNESDLKLEKDSSHRVTKVKVPEYLHLFKLKTKPGKEVVATENHEFLVANSRGMKWKHAEEISTDDYLATARFLSNNSGFTTLNVLDLFKHGEIIRFAGGKFRLRKCMVTINETRLGKDFFELVGFVIGDGHLSKHALDLVFSRDERGQQLKQKYSKIISRYFGLDNPTVYSRHSFENVMWNNKTLKEVFIRVGIPQGKKDTIVSISPKLLSANNHCIAALIRGLIESDGNLYHGGIEFSTHSSKLAKQLPLLLLRFGIQSHRTSRRCHDCDGYKHRVLICGHENLVKYREKIGFSTTQRKKRFTQIVNSKKISKSQTSLIPGVNTSLRQLHKLLKIPNNWSPHFTYYKRGKIPTKRNLKEYYAYFKQRHDECTKVLAKNEINIAEILDVFHISMREFSKNAGISREYLRFIRDGKKPGKNAQRKLEQGVTFYKGQLDLARLHLDNLNRFLESSIVWEKVSDVSVPPRLDLVYDITMKNNQSYLIDGVVVHNCGRHERGDIGIKVCMGDRGEAMHEAEALLQKHRRLLRDGLEFAKDKGLEERDNCFVLDAGTHIQDTLIGVIAGMVYSFKEVSQDKPILGLALDEEGQLKASGRGNWALVHKGLHLGKALKQACEQLGGEGGGHSIAAGARVAPEKKEEFIQLFDSLVGKQLKREG